MNGLPSPNAALAEVHYPDSDSEPMAETELHLLALLTLVALLRYHFRNRPDVFAIGDMFWYYQEGNPEARKAPDIMVVKGVDPSPPKGRRSFKSWEEKANPCFILELTSEGTAEEDTHNKLRLYERLGVREYFLFDPLREFLDQPLMGYRLIGEHYEPVLPAKDGSLPSNELGLRLVSAGADIVLVDMRTNRPLLDVFQSAAQLEILRREIEKVRLEREQFEQALAAADARAAAERQRAEVAVQLADIKGRLADALQRQVDALLDRTTSLEKCIDLEHRRADLECQQKEELQQRLAAVEAELARQHANPAPPPIDTTQP